MIRRKLTRIEVTLDETKELDDFFLKAPQISTVTTTTGTTTATTASKQGFYQKQAVSISKNTNIHQSTILLYQVIVQILP